MGQQGSFKNKKVISFSGKIASGKDTLANALQMNLKKDLNVNFEIISFGYFLKDELKDFIDNLYFDERILSNIFQISIDDVKKCKEILYTEENRDIKNKTNNIRKLLQYYGTNIRRKQDKNYWINRLIYYIKNSKTNNFIITDSRFVNEIESLNIFDTFKIDLRISKNEQLRRITNRDGTILSLDELNHLSECELDDYKNFDLILDVDDKKINECTDLILKKVNISLDLK